MLKCHNDGKGKFQSYEVYYDGEYPISEIPRGFGETFEEAYDEYIKNLINYINACNKIFDVDKSSVSMVDWSGKEIK